MDFIAVDVETANYHRGSICQIGLTTVRNGELQGTETLFVDPQVEFDPFNISIHGIDAASVAGSPTFPEIKEKLRSKMSTLPVISYGAFDRAAFALADDGRVETPFLADHPWINAQTIVRRAWPEHFAKKYNLRLVADTLGLSLDHHDAGSDAEVAARAVVMAAEKLKMNLEQLIARTKQPIIPGSYGLIKYEVGDEGPLAEEVITFTGALALPRAEAAKLANELGAGVSAGTTKKTTILVVGAQDCSKIIGDKSSKHRKAEDLVSQGQTIEFITESDFIAILAR